MKKSWLKTLWIFISGLKPLWVSITVIVLIGGYSYFRSIATNINFIVAVDQILLVIIGEVWKFISTPTVFIAFLASILLWTFRENVRTIFPALRELSAAGISAKFDYPRDQPKDTILIDVASATGKLLPPNITKTQPSNQQDEQLFIKVIISRLAPETCNFLLDLDNKMLTTSGVTERIQTAGILSWWARKMPDENKKYYYQGVFRTLYSAIIIRLFDITITQDTQEAHFILKTDAKELLIARIQELGDIDEDNNVNRAI
jgi:hypothetical protein